MVSRRNVKLTNSSHQAERSAEVFAPHAAARLRPLLEAVVEPGETLPDVELLMRLLGRVLRVSGARLWSAEDDLDTSSHESLNWRQRRDQLKAELHECLVQMRRGAEGSFTGGEAMFGLPGRIARTPFPLLRQAHAVLRNLEAAPGRGWGQRLLPGMQFDFAVHIARLRSVADRFEAACGSLIQFTQQGHTDRATRDRIYLLHHRDLVKVTRALRGLLEFGDLDKEARSVRPRRRRKGETGGDADEPATPATAAPTAGSDTPEGKG